MSLCRICSKTTTLVSLTKPLYYPQAKSVKDMLETIVPELKKNATPKDAICHACLFSLEQFYNFRTTCLENEETVKQYIDNCNSSVPVDLFEVVEYNKNQSHNKKRIRKNEPTDENARIPNDKNSELCQDCVIHPNGVIEQIVCLDIDLDSGKRIENIRVYKKHLPSTNQEETIADATPQLADASAKPTDCQKKEQLDPNSSTCPACKKVFKKQTALQKHVTKCHETEGYKCQLCEKTFLNSAHLKRHLQGHTGEKPHGCDLCEKKFSEKGALYRHRLTHSADKPFKCQICEKCFVQRVHLSTHLLTHTGEKKFRCEVCYKEFRHRCSFKTHVRVHTGEAPYHCDVCNLSFRDGSCYRRHLQRQTHYKRS